MKLGELVNIKTGKLDANVASEKGKYPFFTCSVAPLKIDTYSYDTECVLVAGNGDLNVKYYNGKFDAYQRTYIIESINTDVLNVKYLYYFLEKYVEKLRYESIGGVIKYIKKGNLTEALIPIYPVEVQKNLAAYLDKAVFLLEKRKNQIQSIEVLNKSLFYEFFDDPIRNSNKYLKAPLKDLLSEIQTGWSPVASKEPALNGELGVLKLSSVTGGRYSYKENKMLLEGTPFKSEYEVKNGDVLVTRKNTRDLVGACCFVFDTQPNLMFSDLIFRFIIKDFNKMHPIYLWILLNTQTMKRETSLLASGSSGSMPNISKKNLNELLIMVPPIELQLEFVDKVLEAEKLRSEFIQSLITYQNLYKSMLQKAFKGELFQD